jgi:hypothetical protein
MRRPHFHSSNGSALTPREQRRSKPPTQLDTSGMDKATISRLDLHAQSNAAADSDGLN